MRVQIRGLDELRRDLGAPQGAMGPALRKGLLAGAVIVEAAAKTGVHSPDNPWVGKAGYSVATGKLQSALGIGNVEGSGLRLSVRVGHPHGRALGAFGRSTPTGRTGRRVNRSDPAIYGPIEERRHPFLDPAVRDNEECDVHDASSTPRSAQFCTQFA